MTRTMKTIFIFAATVLALQAYLAHASAQGVLPGRFDSSFGVGGIVTSTFGQIAPSVATKGMTVQSDGKILVVIDGIPSFAVARFTESGSLDPTFDGDGVVTTIVGNSGSSAHRVGVQSDGRIIVGGVSTSQVGGAPAITTFALVRYNANGSIDSTFGTGGIVTTVFGTSSADAPILQDLEILPDDRIVAAGYLTRTGVGFQAGILARYSPNGTPDSGFGSNGQVTLSGGDCMIINDIAVQSDYKVLATGSGSCTSAETGFSLYRLDENGSLDQTFDSDGKVKTEIGPFSDLARRVAFDGLGRVVLVGDTEITGTGETDIAIVRYKTNGSPDGDFGNSGVVVTRISNRSEQPDGVVVQTDGRILVLAEGLYSISSYQAYVLRYRTDGSLDPSFGESGKVTLLVGDETLPRGIGLDSGGKIVVSGWRLLGNATAGLVVRFYGRRSHVDFDGDNRTDISIYRPSLGQWWLNRSSDGLIVQTFGIPSDTIVPADLTGDGKTDVAIWRAGEWFVLRSEDYTYYSVPFGSSGDIPVPADFDGDGKDDTAVFRPSTSTWYISRSSGGTTIETFGAAGDRPVPADYDGDGRADIAIYRPSEGQWWLNRSTAGVIVYTFGNSSDRNVQGDYTGDGKADVAIWRPSTGEWFILRSEDASYFSFPWGLSTDLPVPGDYDGDGKFDAGVFRPSSGTWYLNRSTAGTLIQGFGLPTDLLVPSAFVR